jgi:hypothetical protein
MFAAPSLKIGALPIIVADSCDSQRSGSDER